MKYLIINQFALPPSQNGGIRHFLLAKKLIALGHEVDIVASNLHYSSRASFYVNSDCENIEGVGFYWIKTSSYSNGFTRLYNHLQFLVKLLLLLFSGKLEKPDVIIGSSPQPFAALGGWIYSKKINVDFWYEVRDLWPASLVDLDIISRANPVYFIFLWIEWFLAKKSKRIYCLMPLGAEYFKQIGVLEDKIYWAPNFVDFEGLPSSRSGSVKKSTPCFEVAYFGSHSISDGLDFIIELAYAMQEINLRFRFVGSGPEKDTLINKVQQLNLQNVVFDDPVSKSEVYSELQSATVCLVIVRPSKLYQWGISFNKIYDYFSTKKPILFIGNVSCNPVTLSNSGIVVESLDVDECKNALLRMMSMSKSELSIYGISGYEYAKKNYSLNVIAGKFEF